MYMTQTTPSDQKRWAEMYWLGGTMIDSHGRNGSLALRLQRSDNQWYVTRGYTEAVHLLHGPIASKDAAVMMIEMGVVDV